jgi:hypothetical protein
MKQVVCVLTVGFFTAPPVVTAAAPPELEWQRTFASSLHDEGYDVVQTADGGFFVVGSTEGATLLLLKTDAAGNDVWSATMNEHHADVSRAIHVTPEGDYLIAGHATHWPGSDNNDDVLLMKVSASGGMSPHGTYGGVHLDYGRSVAAAPDGGYAVAGYTWQAREGDDFFADVLLLKTDRDGTELWQRQYDEGAFEYGEALLTTAASLSPAWRTCPWRTRGRSAVSVPAI